LQIHGTSSGASAIPKAALPGCFPTSRRQSGNRPRAEECAEAGKKRQDDPNHREGLHDWFDGKMVSVQVAHSTNRSDFDDTV
jgi:hypothetical protein